MNKLNCQLLSVTQKGTRGLIPTLKIHTIRKSVPTNNMTVAEVNKKNTQKHSMECKKRTMIRHKQLKTNFANNNNSMISIQIDSIH